jgi:hypothetical protein
MVLNDTFNNISVISWRSFLLVEEIGVPRENPPTCHVTDKLQSHDVVSRNTPIEWDSNSQLKIRNTHCSNCVI